MTLADHYAAVARGDVPGDYDDDSPWGPGPADMWQPCAECGEDECDCAEAREYEADVRGTW